MNKTTSRKLLNYYRTRPEEARELAEILLMALGKDLGADEVAERGADRWLSASEVGRELGRSHQWVKDHDGALPLSAKRLSESGRRTRLYLWNANTQHLFNIQL